MTVLRVCYKQGVRFDEAYYTSKHLPLVGTVMGPYGVNRIEMLKLTTAMDGSKPPYQVMFSAYFESAAGLQNAMQSPRIGEVLGDIQNFYDGMPDVFIGDLVPLAPGK
jgi:uncharacterized protein (TIGR02118 family)